MIYKIFLTCYPINGKHNVTMKHTYLLYIILTVLVFFLATSNNAVCDDIIKGEVTLKYHSQEIGALQLIIAQKGLKVFLDNRYMGETNDFDKGLFIDNLSSGVYLVEIIDSQKEKIIRKKITIVKGQKRIIKLK